MVKENEKSDTRRSKEQKGLGVAGVKFFGIRLNHPVGGGARASERTDRR